MECCTLCPRQCKANRSAGQKGYCQETAELQVARAALHMWEEPCISGENGSGTVFFSGCSLGCVFCQNIEISRGRNGLIICVERLSEIFIELQNKGANNINLVTPSHFVPQIIMALDLAREKGLNLPIVYNSSGYECVSTLMLLEGYVDVYLPDMKYFDGSIAAKYSNAPGYFEIARKAIEEMVRQVGKPVFNDSGIIQKGVIVRHLVLPGYVYDSKKIIKYLYETYGNDIYLSIMNQFTPLEHIGRYPEINRKLTKREYNNLVDYAINLGVENGFIQEGETAKESFIPEFNNEGVSGTN